MSQRFLLLLAPMVGCGPNIVGEWDVRTLEVEIADSDVGVRGEDGRMEVDSDLDVSLELTFDDDDDVPFTIDVSGVVEDDGGGDYTLDLEGDLDAGTGAFDYAGKLDCTVDGADADCEGDLDVTGDVYTYYGYYSGSKTLETTLKVTFRRR